MTDNSNNMFIHRKRIIKMFFLFTLMWQFIHLFFHSFIKHSSHNLYINTNKENSTSY